MQNSRHSSMGSIFLLYLWHKTENGSALATLALAPSYLVSCRYKKRSSAAAKSILACFIYLNADLLCWKTQGKPVDFGYFRYQKVDHRASAIVATRRGVVLGRRETRGCHARHVHQWIGKTRELEFWFIKRLKQLHRKAHVSQPSFQRFFLFVIFLYTFCDI